jgi:hypothetical protein
MPGGGQGGANSGGGFPMPGGGSNAGGGFPMPGGGQGQPQN